MDRWLGQSFENLQLLWGGKSGPRKERVVSQWPGHECLRIHREDSEHHSMWVCIAADYTGSTRNGHVTIRTGLRSNGRRCLSLMTHVFLYITQLVRCLCVAYLGNTCHQEALWEGGEAVEAVSGNVCAPKRWVLPSIWIFLWHVSPAELCCRPCTRRHGDRTPWRLWSLSAV